ncbi:two-component sensor histidine kinase [Thalassobacillus devorans]|uniref:Two-component sensor histidine kinase n=2 Tax=Thalassobacillus devorans TaxID=279813 RepID=A0ABQ1NXM9_9BACI|nr:sensor histidine kinase [Thalassobacillus devorans]NIK28582.1 two-component system sensor histidine kinase YesM [Thalassobacillus devorans]GGC85102.1 two-component sensor histidine kinase [Thalassobacillus devorans]
MKALISLIKKLSGRMFYRIFFTYTTIILMAMSALFIILSSYYSDFVIQREMDRQRNVIEEIQSELQKKHAFVKQGIRQLYLDKTLLQDLSFALQHDYQAYLDYRLDKYYESDSLVPYNFDIFVSNYFSSDSEVIAAVVRNEVYGSKYEYIYNHSQWNLLDDDEKELLRTPKNVHVLSEQINDPTSLDKLGTIDVLFSYRNIDQLLTVRENLSDVSFKLIDAEGNVRYAFGEGDYQAEKTLTYQSIQDGYIEDNGYLVQGLVDPVSELMITAAIPESKVENLTSYKLSIFLIILVLTLFSIGIPFLSLKNYSKRVNQMNRKMKEVQKGDLSVRMDTTTADDDLNVISSTFNETLDTLEEYINKVYFSRLKQKEAELANLQAQINPHFLYNTLEAIRMKAIAEGGRVTGKMIVQLADLFRYSLQTAELIPILDEKDHAYQYLELFKIRFPNQLTSEFHIDPAVMDAYVPPFILQPIIENYLLHGLKRDRLDNKVSTRITKKGELLHIVIEDNGKGIEPQHLEEIQERLASKHQTSSSIGLGNVNERIKMKFGDDYGIKLNSEPGSHTIVQIVMPLLKEVESHDQRYASG